MIGRKAQGPMFLQGRLSERPEANRIPTGTMFAAIDSGEMFVTVRTPNPEWMRSGGSSLAPPARKMICENCGGPHEPHETHCSWCKRRLP